MSNTRENGKARNIRQRRIVVVAIAPIDELNLVGPVQVFSAANRLSGKAIYSIEIVTNRKELTLKGKAGMLAFLAHGLLADVSGAINSVVLVCGQATRFEKDPFLSRWLNSIAPKVKRLGAVCIGSFLLAEAGLLNGKRATTHWKFSNELATKYPKVKVESEPIWVKDENIYTSAGISSGIDLALAWVEEDCGTALAQEIAREFVLFLRRPAGQQQLSVSLAKQSAESKSIRELQVWIAENLDKNLPVHVLAARVAMSIRNFERVFTRESKCTPARYVTQLRVESACRQLEHTEKSVDQIARSCGFTSADLMRRAFLRSVGTTPAEYRNRLSRQRG